MIQAEPYLVRRTDTALLAVPDRTDLWVEHVCRNHGTLDFRFDDPASFGGGTVVQRYAGRQLVTFWSAGIRYARTAADVRRDDDDSGRLLLPVAGTIRAQQDDTAVEVAPGRAMVITKARPVVFEHERDVRAVMLNLPGEAVPRTVRGPVVFGVRGGLGSVVASMITTVAAQCDAVDGPQFRLVSDTIAELLAQYLRPREPVPDTLAVVDAAVREYVRQHAANTALDPTKIARDLGWSLRQVQLALQRTGTTPSGLLRDTRLDMARRLLTDAPPSRTVADIAHACGFQSLSVFGAAFKRRFGMTPRESRHWQGEH
ncbi:AraC family transcriptional regulator [Pseudonocardia xinjiangensis]|uniref:AraC family transcriptional regulator n=1 Tax=Pseudonocardia xinjiangensis TaxID=75289 RepID=UPI003D8C8F7C